ncbi:MAG: T9SS type A sorting domain-containing protein, partial [Flavobacteriales bacterium]|nr:T9SS type A sorting domain-containing protein [Flavobacteriales bacterium]
KKGKGKSDKGEHHKGKGQCGDKMPESRHANMSKEEMTLKFGVKFLLKKPSAEKVEIENDSPAIATDAKIKNGTLYFNHPFDGIVNIDLIDKEGKLMRNILNDFLDAGPQEIDLKMNELSTGELYFIRLSEGGRVSTQKFIKTE